MGGNSSMWKDITMLQQATPALEGKIADLVEFFPPNYLLPPLTFGSLVEDLFADRIPFPTGICIPAADKPQESVSFEHRELLVRFAGLHINDQAVFLDACRKALEKYNVTVLHLHVAWSKSGFRKKVIKVKCAPGTSAKSLTFSLV